MTDDELYGEFIEALNDFKDLDEPTPCICGKRMLCHIDPRDSIKDECGLIGVNAFTLGVLQPAFSEGELYSEEIYHNALKELTLYVEDNSNYNLQHDLVYRRIREFEVDNGITLEELLEKYNGN